MCTGALLDVDVFVLAGLAESRADQAPKRSALQTSAYVRRGLKPLSITIPPASSTSSFFPITIPPLTTSPCSRRPFFLAVSALYTFPKKDKLCLGCVALTRCLISSAYGTSAVRHSKGGDPVAPSLNSDYRLVIVAN